MASELDPKRYPTVRLADPSHTLPVPGTRRHFSQEAAGERVDAHDPFWALLIADKSLVPVAAPEPEPAAAPEPHAA